MTTLPASGRRPWSRAAVFDRAEQLAIILLWCLFLVRIEVSGNIWAIFPLLTETSVLLFTLIRRPTENLSTRPSDWLIAAVATWGALLVLPADPIAPELIPIGIFLSLIGSGFQLWAKLVLRRSFGIAPANRGVKITGPYRFVRHPMYAGYALGHIASLILMFSPVNLLIYGFSWTAQIFRLLAEERFLKQDPLYVAYAAKVRWRLIPGLF